MRSSLTWKSLVLRGLAGVVVFALINVVTYQGVQYFQREREYHAEVSAYFDRQGADAVFAGDSHVAQLDKDLLANDVYNIAWGGDSLREVYAKLRYLLSRGAPIHTLFLTADPHMFGDGRLQSSNRAFVDGYLLLTASPYGLDKGWPSAALGTVPLFNDDFVQYLKKKISVSLKREPATEVRDDAQAWLALSDAEREKQAAATGIGDHRGIGTHQEPFLWFERISALARSRGVHIIAIQYPSHPAYIRGITAQSDALVNAELARLGITDVIDLRNAFSDPSLFKDEDHVSRKGAITLLRLLSKRTGRQLLGGAAAADPVAAVPRSGSPVLQRCDAVPASTAGACL
jgi:hypothetical protein